MIEEWQEPWDKVDDPGTGSEELEREVSRKHVLYGIPTTQMGRRVDCDDTLFRLDDGSGRYAVVHLTWSKERDPRWPSTEIYQDYEDWWKSRYLPDLEEWNKK